MAIPFCQDVSIPWIHTPLIKSDTFSTLADCRVFLKLENIQPSGSFKMRGIGNLIRSHVLRDARSRHHFFCSSGGNAGLACTKAAVGYGFPATVVVPVSTSRLMMDKLTLAGANVVQVGATWAEADRQMQEVEMAKAPGAVYVPPFDDQRIWDGHATMIGEIKEQLQVIDGNRAGDEGKPDVVICSVGGGGLFCGVVEGLERNFSEAQRAPVFNGESPREEPVRVLGVETRGADSLAASIEAREHVTLPGITSMARTLGAVRVAPRAFELAQSRPEIISSVVLSDAQAALGCWELADRERILVEASCGVSIAACNAQLLRKMVPGLMKQSRVVIIVCGGSDVTLEMLADYRSKYAGDPSWQT